MQTDPHRLENQLSFLKALSDNALGMFQQPISPEIYNGLLLAGDTVAGLGLALAAGIGLSKVIQMRDAGQLIEKNRSEIIANGKLEKPVGLVGHTVLVAQSHPFLNNILRDLSNLDQIKPFLISKRAGNQFNPHQESENGEAMAEFWLSTKKPHDDRSLKIADFNGSLRLVIMASQTDNLILSGENSLGLSIADIENTIINAQRLKGDREILLIVPSREVVSDAFRDSLAKNDVNLEKVRIVVIDDLLLSSLTDQLTQMPVDSVNCDVGDYNGRLADLLNKFYGVQIEDKKAVRDFNTIMQALYVLGIVYRRGGQDKKYAVYFSHDNIRSFFDRDN